MCVCVRVHAGTCHQAIIMGGSYTKKRYLVLKRIIKLLSKSALIYFTSWPYVFLKMWKKEEWMEKRRKGLSVWIKSEWSSKSKDGEEMESKRTKQQASCNRQWSLHLNVFLHSVNAARLSEEMCQELAPSFTTKKIHSQWNLLLTCTKCRIYNYSINWIKPERFFSGC